MATFLLTWNPTKTPWPDLDNDTADLRDGETVTGNWSTGSRKEGIAPGDRFFMLRQGPEPRGIMAVGSIDSEVYQDRHWTGQGTAYYVDICFDALVNPVEEPDLMIPMRELIERFEGRHYFTRVQGSAQNRVMAADKAAA